MPMLSALLSYAFKNWIHRTVLNIISSSLLGDVYGSQLLFEGIAVMVLVRFSGSATRKFEPLVKRGSGTNQT